MQRIFVILCIATAVQCYTLTNGNSLEVHTVNGGGVTVKLEYQDDGPPIPSCCATIDYLHQLVLAGTVVTEVAHLRDLGYLLRIDFMENILTCHLVPDVKDTQELSSSLCSHLTCPVGWNLLQDTCFLVSQASGSWEEGQAYCQHLGGALASISNNFQQTALSDMLTSDTWIGLKHIHQNDSLGCTNGMKHTYASWAADECNKTEIQKEEDCVQMSQNNNFLWTTTQCNHPKKYLCSVPGIDNTGTRHKTIQSTTKASTTSAASESTTTYPTTYLPDCPSGWRNYQSSCYKRFIRGRTYGDATDHCRALGGYLASIRSEEEQSFVQSLFSTPWEADTYIGLNDIEDEGNFVWQDGSPFNYSRWRSGYPDNAGDSDCGGIVPSVNFTWMDWQCYQQRQYVCSMHGVGSARDP